MATNNTAPRIAIKTDGKLDEMQTLERIASAVPERSYLAGLFTPEFVDWVESKISDDVIPDLYEAYMVQLSNAARATSEAAQLRRELDRANVKIAGLQTAHSQLDNVRAENAKLRAAATDDGAALEEAYDRIAELENDLVAARNAARAASEARADMDVTEARIAELEADKAELRRVWQEAEAALVRAWANTGHERMAEQLAAANAATSALIDANNANLAELAREREARRAAEVEVARLKMKLAAIASYAGDE